MDQELRNEKWLELFYNRVTDLYSLSRDSLHNTHQWAITLIFGLVTAILTLSTEGNGFPNEMGFIAVLLSLPLMFRFFVRSCLEYSIQEKWKVIRDTFDNYYYCRDLNQKQEEDAQNYLREVIDLYYFKWKCPSSLLKIAFSNLKLAYFWPFLLYIFFIVWGAAKLQMTTLIGTVSIITCSFLVYEIFSFIKYRGFEFEEPTSPCPWKKKPNRI